MLSTLSFLPCLAGREGALSAPAGDKSFCVANKKTEQVQGGRGRIESRAFIGGGTGRMNSYLLEVLLLSICLIS